MEVKDFLAVKQLAAALMSSWDARNDSPRALDSFKLFQSVAKIYFNLEIKGNVGDIVDFNKIAYEPLDKIGLQTGAKVQVLRPGVVFEDKDTRKVSVLIPALISPCECG